MTTGRNTRLQIVHAARQCYCGPSRGGATRRLAASYTSRLASILEYQNRPRPAFPAPPRELFVAVGVAAAVHRARFMPDRLTVLALPQPEHKRNITRNITGLSTVYPQDTQRTNARGSLHHGDTMGRLLASNRQGQCADTERRLRGYCATCDAKFEEHRQLSKRVVGPHNPRQAIMSDERMVYPNSPVYFEHWCGHEGCAKWVSFGKSTASKPHGVVSITWPTTTGWALCPAKLMCGVVRLRCIHGRIKNTRSG